MTIISAVISQCRREFGDQPKSTRVSRDGNASVNLFNTGKFPIMENSYSVYVSGVAKSEGGDYSIDLDNGDIQFVSTPANGVAIVTQHKYAYWRDRNWVDAINDTIQDLNARGFFKQVSRSTSVFSFSAGVQKYSGPTNCVDLYELLVSSNNTTSGSFTKPNVNWSYQQDSNSIILGNKPTTNQVAAVSYLRNLRTYTATSATMDTLDTWDPIVVKGAGARFYRYLAGKIAKQGNATVDEGHFSFTNLRTMANDLENEYEKLTMRKKPTRPAKDLQYFFNEGGVA